LKTAARAMGVAPHDRTQPAATGVCKDRVPATAGLLLARHSRAVGLAGWRGFLARISCHVESSNPITQ